MQKPPQQFGQVQQAQAASHIKNQQTRLKLMNQALSQRAAANKDSLTQDDLTAIDSSLMLVASRQSSE